MTAPPEGGPPRPPRSTCVSGQTRCLAHATSLASFVCSIHSFPLNYQLPVSLATMLFQFPSEDDAFFKRFFLITAFSIEVIIEVFLPVLLAFVLVVAIALLCANMLGLTQNSPDETTGQQTVREGRADSADLALAVDEKTLLNIEMKILEEMLQTRRTRLNGLAKSD